MYQDVSQSKRLCLFRLLECVNDKQQKCITWDSGDQEARDEDTGGQVSLHGLLPSWQVTCVHPQMVEEETGLP